MYVLKDITVIFKKDNITYNTFITVHFHFTNIFNNYHGYRIYFKL